jgi:hypothetical protein
MVVISTNVSSPQWIFTNLISFVLRAFVASKALDQRALGLGFDSPAGHK